ncbi:MAG TPA: ATP-binding protein [Candidatus Binatia bacterium]|jgi:signal transduction histidine kinase|nr:ATP-binding protein [Candidatus Binatia bacterium]
MSQNKQPNRPLALVVDDDMVLRPLLCEVLQQAGFVVEEAEEGEKALSLFLRTQPDIVLLDVMLPKMDGFTLCATLRTLPGGEHTPVLVVTGLGDTESIRRAYEVGATDFITKPLNWDILSHRVRYMLRASRAIEDLRKQEAENHTLLLEAKRTAEELLTAKEEAEAADRAKTEFLATMSHELRTPLNAILGYTQLFLTETFGTLTAEQDYALQRVEKNARELLDLISAVLDVSRLRAGQLPVEIKEVRVAELLKEIETETQEIREQTNVMSVWKVERGLPSLYTDPGKLKTVIKNLIGNAVKFTEKGSITVDAHGYESGIEIDVIDTGVGISADELPIIFEPFRQLESTRTRQFSGTGLGLHIVKRLLELLGGRIAVESEVGRGSIFRVWVPMSRSTPTEMRTVA